MQILCRNTIKAIDPAFQTAKVTVDVLDMVHAFYTLFTTRFETIMSQIFFIRI